MRTTAFLVAAVIVVLSITGPTTSWAGGDKVANPYETAESYDAKGDYQRALKYYRMALSANDVRAHYRMAVIYEKTGRKRDAIRHYRRFIELGSYGSDWKDASARLKTLEAELAAQTPRAQSLLDRGRSLYMEGRYRDAEKVLLEALDADETNPEVHYFLGEVYLELGDYDRAKSEFNKAKRYY